MTPNDQVLAFIRTYVPYAIGAGAAWLLVAFAIHLPDDLLVALTAFFVVAAQNVYYLLIRLVERQVPWLGVLLGWPKQPTYTGVADLWGSVLRTGLPTLAGALVFGIGYLIATIFGFHLDAQSQTGLIVIILGVLQGAYYAAAKWIIAKIPAAGWLLGGVPAPAMYVGG